MSRDADNSFQGLAEIAQLIVNRKLYKLSNNE